MNMNTNSGNSGDQKDMNDKNGQWKEPRTMDDDKKRNEKNYSGGTADTDQDMNKEEDGSGMGE